MFLLIELKLWTFDYHCSKATLTSTHSGKKSETRKNSFLNASQENFPIFCLLVKSENNKQQLSWHSICTIQTLTCFQLIFWLHFHSQLCRNLKWFWNFTLNFSPKLLLRLRRGSKQWRASRANVCVCFQAAVKCFYRGCVLCEIFFRFALPWAGSSRREQKQ